MPGNGLAIESPSGKKLIWRFALMQENFGRDELFDRVVDPGERQNLLAESAAERRLPGSPPWPPSW